MTMDDREKLVEIMGDLDCNAEYCGDCEFCIDLDGCVRRQKEIIADHFIANGVIVPPVKVGQKLYTIPRSAIREWTVCGVWISADPKCSYAHVCWEKDEHRMSSRAVNFGDLGRVFFFTREEAEAALTKWRKENGYG